MARFKELCVWERSSSPSTRHYTALTCLSDDGNRGQHSGAGPSIGQGPNLAYRDKKG